MYYYDIMLFLSLPYGIFHALDCFKTVEVTISPLCLAKHTHLLECALKMYILLLTTISIK